MISCRYILMMALLGLLMKTAAYTTGWKVRADIPYHVYGHGGAVMDGKYHALGGCDTPDWTQSCKRHQVYDPAKDRWSLAADIPIELGWPMPAVYKGRIYLFGGQRNGARAIDKAWVYDPATDRWAGIRDMPKPITNGFAIAMGDFIYVGLGYNRQGGKYGKEGATDVPEQYHGTYRYNPSDDTYTPVADAPEYGIYIAVGSYKGSIYAVPGVQVESGWHNMEEHVWSDGALKYTPGTDTWAKIRAPRGSRRVFYLTQCSSSVSYGSKLFVVGGMAEKHGRTGVKEGQSPVSPT